MPSDPKVGRGRSVYSIRSEHVPTPSISAQIVDTVTAIFDLKNVSLLGFWKVKDLLYRLIQISDVRSTEACTKVQYKCFD